MSLTLYFCLGNIWYLVYMDKTSNKTQQMKYEEVLAQYGECITHVTGWSMEPLFHDRQSIVRVVPFPERKINVGDVVLYKAANQYILHRVMEIRDDSIIARGDNNWFLERVMLEEIIGVMTGFWRKPCSTYVTCDHWKYKSYINCLPCIRQIKKCLAGGKHAAKNALSFITK